MEGCRPGQHLLNVLPPPIILLRFPVPYHEYRPKYQAEQMWTNELTPCNFKRPEVIDEIARKSTDKKTYRSMLYS